VRLTSGQSQDRVPGVAVLSGIRRERPISPEFEVLLIKPLVEWCDVCLRSGWLPDRAPSPHHRIFVPPPTSFALVRVSHSPVLLVEWFDVELKCERLAGRIPIIAFSRVSLRSTYLTMVRVHYSPGNPESQLTSRTPSSRKRGS
jgi:hypothetical protein